MPAFKKSHALVLAGVVLIAGTGAWRLLRAPASHDPAPAVATAIPERTPQPGEHLPLKAPCFGENVLAGKDYAAAYQSFIARAGQDARAEFHLGVMFRDGLGVLRNPQMAIDRFLRGAERGDVESMTALGWMFSGDRDTGTNYAEAFRWYEKAALKGDRVAQFRLAGLYADGSGTPRDRVAAYAWLLALGTEPVAVGRALPGGGELPVAPVQQQVYRELTRAQAVEAGKRATELKKKVAANGATTKRDASCTP